MFPDLWIVQKAEANAKEPPVAKPKKRKGTETKDEVLVEGP